LGAIALAVLGPGTNLEYFTSVLPAHALSEIARDTQYSLTAVFYSLGASQTLALRAGGLWYVAMLALGTLLAGLLVKKTGNKAFLACVPPAFAVFGGTFIHITQITAALPAAVLLVTFAKKEHRTLAVVALLALSVPWAWVVSPAMIVAPLFPIAYLAWCYWGDSLLVVLLAAIAAAVLTLGLGELAAVAPHAIAHRMPPVIDVRLAEASWSAFTQKSSTNGIAAWILRVPTWAGIALLLSLLMREASPLRLRGSRPVRYVSREAP
jgi:hypothetical protein